MPGAVSTNGVSRQREKILVVDDNPDNLEILRHTLADCGCELLTAQNGRETLDLARRCRPALILLDILMPQLDGFETCRQLKNDPATRDAAVIFLSGLDEVKNKVRGLGLGAVDYVTKPFQAEEILARVNAHLTIHRLNHELQARCEEIERELAVVANVQRSLLPQQLPQTAGLRLAAYYATSRYAGGDYYDVTELPNGRWGILVADAAGHGTLAAVLMSMTYAVFHAYPKPPTEPADVLTYLNRHLSAFSGDSFVTALYAVYDARERTLLLGSAGHAPPLLHRPTTQSAAPLACEPAPPLGAGLESKISTALYSLRAGDQLLFYTDGVIERHNPRREMYGLERLQRQLATTAADDDAERKVQTIMRDVDQFAAGQPAGDDQTLLLGIVR